MSQSPLPPPINLTFQELAQRWQCTDARLRELTATGQIVPSLSMKGFFSEVALDPNGQPQNTGRSVHLNRLMYVMGIQQLGPFDCAFNYCADRPEGLRVGTVFKAEGNGFVDIRPRMANIESEGVFAIAEVERVEAAASHGSAVPAAATAPQTIKQVAWWNTQHDVLVMAKEIEQKAKHQGWGLNQSGARAGKYPLAAIGQKVADEINRQQGMKGSPKKIGARSVSKFLKKQGWK